MTRTLADYRDIVRKLVAEQIESVPSDSEKLISSGRLTSLMIVEVILSIEDAIGVQLNPPDIKVEQFDTIDLMAETVESLAAR